MAAAGDYTLVSSPQVISELEAVLLRDKFRRWLSIEEVGSFLDAVTSVSDHVQDPDSRGWAPVCRDPDDDYLVFLAEESNATFLVSGDRDLDDLLRPGPDVRTPSEALDALTCTHPWDDGLTLGRDANVVMRQAEGEGHAAVLGVTMTFIAAISSVDGVQHAYPRDGVALVKLPPDPGDDVKAVGPVRLPGDTLLLMLVHRPDLPSPAEFGGWRVHAVGRPEAFTPDFLDANSLRP